MRRPRAVARSRWVRSSAAVLLIGLFTACDEEGSPTRVALPDRVDFNFDIKPILADRCFHCHGPDEAVRESELRLDTEEGAFHELAGEPGAFAIVRGDRDASVLYRRISSDDPNELMPPPESNRSLSEHEIALLGRWIDQDAEWRRHWAFITPARPTPPDVNAAGLHSVDAGNEIDRFVLARLERDGLALTAPADAPTLIRRVSFDLTGLPPTLEELDDFLADESPDAFERVVDRLLASPAFGERMASHWLDAARYADSHGYQDDLERSMWPWRDWVIHAFNTNLPFDEFGRWQLAGDLLPDATTEQVLATGFNRNHMITQEGGVIDEEFRVAYVADRVSTTATVFLGLTIDCARCHDHKFDPISQTDYYSFFAFFNNVPEQGVIDYQTVAAEPALRLRPEEVREALPFIAAIPEGDTLRSMIMADMDTLVRPTYVLERGRYDKPLAQVPPGTPEALLPFGDRPTDRTGLADWLFDPANPLTSRVTVNRFWSLLFGRGIVPTINDFGNQGAIPSHPELLDWLATSFVASGWDTKALLKTIVMSATYRQSSIASADLLERDPDNVTLGRGPRFRLPGEALRDQVLAVSGLLVRDIGGPSVKPYQPDGIWEEKTGGGGGSLARYVPDEGGKLYRRSLYTFWKRTVPPPSMMAFDVPDRSLTAVHRQTTSTPLQSLVLMNDPQWTEAARALAYRLMQEEGVAESRIPRAFRLLTARQPTTAEAGELVAYFHEETARFARETDRAEALLAVGALPHPDGVDPSEAAAYTMVVSTIFNLYETITRN